MKRTANYELIEPSHTIKGSTVLIACHLCLVGNFAKTSHRRRKQVRMSGFSRNVSWREIHCLFHGNKVFHGLINNEKTVKSLLATNRHEELSRTVQHLAGIFQCTKTHVNVVSCQQRVWLKSSCIRLISHIWLNN